MKKLSFFLLFSLFISLSLAQDNDYSRDSKQRYANENTPEKKWNFGGGGGLSFGNVTNIMISPQVTYSLTDKVLFGSSLTYIYYKVNWDAIYPGSNWGTYKTSVYGGSLFNNILLIKNVFSHLEIEPLNVEYLNNLNGEYERGWVTGLYAGGGVRQYFGSRSFMQLMMLYNFNFQPGLSPYNSPWVPRITIFF